MHIAHDVAAKPLLQYLCTHSPSVLKQEEVKGLVALVHLSRAEETTSLTGNVAVSFEWIDNLWR